MMKSNQLLNRGVRFSPDQFIVNEEWNVFLGNENGVIEAVSYNKDSHTGNGYYVLVRNYKGQTLELPLKCLILV